MNALEIKKSYEKDGYVNIKGLFGVSEVAEFKATVAKIAGTPSINEDALTSPTLRPLLLDDRILEAVRGLLGPRIAYFGDSSVRYDAVEGSKGFHKDSNNDFDDPSSTDHTVLRIGLYMQDHVKHSGGLKVRRGSHRHVFLGRSSWRRLNSTTSPHGPLKLASFRLGRAINLDTEPGDLVIWNHRIFHSGYAVRLKVWPTLCLHPILEKYIPKSWTQPYEGPRAVLFATFGAPSRNYDIYIKERSEHAATFGYWEACHFDDPEIVRLCEEKGLELRFDGIEARRARQAALGN